MKIWQEIKRINRGEPKIVADPYDNRVMSAREFGAIITGTQAHIDTSARPETAPQVSDSDDSRIVNLLSRIGIKHP